MKPNENLCPECLEDEVKLPADSPRRQCGHCGFMHKYLKPIK